MTRDRALIFANGSIHDGEMVRRALHYVEHAYLIAADGGAHVARHFGITLQTVIGDMDSIEPEYLQMLTKAGATALRYPEAKNETDLELALLHAVEQGAAWIRIIGAVGGRLDQTLSNVYLLALPALRLCDVRLVAGNEETTLLQPGFIDIEGNPGDTVSLIPVTGIARGVRTEALVYPLEDEDLLFGPARGVSNLMAADHARVHLKEGALIVVHTIGRA